MNDLQQELENQKRLNRIQSIEIKDLKTPKWLTYKAFITQAGTNAPTVEVLNSDEVDYLGDIEWFRVDAGTYSGVNVNLLEDLTICIQDQTYNCDYVSVALYSIYVNVINEGTIELITMGSTQFIADNLLFKKYIEIRVKQ